MRAVWQLYRAPCRPFATGCRQCGAEIKPTRATCSAECRQEFERNHFWGTASAEAINRARPFGPALEFKRQPWFGPPVCRRCGKFCESFENKGGVYITDRREAEVNHIVPVNGNRTHFGCCHHQENLEVLCHGCHVLVGIEQRRAGLIGKPKPQLHLPVSFVTPSTDANR